MQIRNIRNKILTIRMQIRTIGKGFEVFKSKIEPFERDFKHLNANSNHSKGIRSIRNQILYIRNQILIIQMGFAAFEIKFKPFKRDSQH